MLPPGLLVVAITVLVLATAGSIAVDLLNFWLWFEHVETVARLATSLSLPNHITNPMIFKETRRW